MEDSVRIITAALLHFQYQEGVLDPCTYGEGGNLEVGVHGSDVLVMPGKIAG
jgi:hypothetical protein